MHRHICDCNKPGEIHTNGFIDLNGFPYLVADYLDRSTFQQIDRCMVDSTIVVDQSEAMRAIVDISVDNIGKNSSDGSLATIGNNTKQVNLVEMIHRNFSRLQSRLPVLRKGIIVRVNYRLENHRTGQTIKSMVEDFKIPNANYFVDINSKNVNDNGIVVNFSGSSVSTINYFTHGRDKMILRITSVDLFYECMKYGPSIPIGKDHFHGRPDEMIPDFFDEYDYHRNTKDRAYLYGYGNEPTEMITPPSWLMFNQFYHFDNGGKDIIIHNEEVYHRNAKVTLVPCGSVVVNRAMVINPCHRIVFKFSIWKNDTTIVNDTTMIAGALRASVRDPYFDGCTEIYPEDSNMIRYDHCHCDKSPVNPDYETLLRMLQSGKNMDYDQNAVINQLGSLVAELTATINDLKGNEEGDSSPEIPTLPEAPKDKPQKPDKPHHKPDPIFEIMKMIRSLQEQINDLKKDESDDPTDDPNKDCDCDCEDNIKPMPDDMIKDAVNGAVDETDPEKNGL